MPLASRQLVKRRRRHLIDRITGIEVVQGGFKRCHSNRLCQLGHATQQHEFGVAFQVRQTSQTGFPYEGGGLNPGVYFDCTNEESFNASDTANGICYAGRYRYVQVDSGFYCCGTREDRNRWISCAPVRRLRALLSPPPLALRQTAGAYQIAAPTPQVVVELVQSSPSLSARLERSRLHRSSLLVTAISRFLLSAFRPLGGTAGTVAAQLDTRREMLSPSADQVSGS